jgi:hypothetical protein
VRPRDFFGAAANPIDGGAQIGNTNSERGFGLARRIEDVKRDLTGIETYGASFFQAIGEVVGRGQPHRQPLLDRGDVFGKSGGGGLPRNTTLFIREAALGVGLLLRQCPDRIVQTGQHARSAIDAGLQFLPSGIVVDVAFNRMALPCGLRGFKCGLRRVALDAELGDARLKLGDDLLKFFHRAFAKKVCHSDVLSAFPAAGLL